MRKGFLSIVLMSVPVLLVIFSCATVTTGPEGLSFSLGKKQPPIADDLELLSIDVPHSGNLSANVEYWATIDFVVRSKIAISKACFNFSGGRQNCVDIQAKDVLYGSHTYFRVPIHVPADSKRIDCYVEYILDETAKRTNAVSYYVIVLKKPEE